MSFILSYTSIAYSKMKNSSRFGGSSCFRVLDDELIDITEAKKKKESKAESKATEKSNTLSEDKEKQEPKEKVKRVYMLNKSKVRKNCHALARLEKSKNFLAFYTITFPVGLTDEVCYQVYNTWLTRCRKSAGLNTYLWVAERQKNGTIHYHLLTNDYMKIQEVNGYMGKALKTQKKKGIEALKDVDIDKYNGVDVKRVKNGSKSLIGYLTKYVTKNDIQFYRLPWHCSRDVSRLFTSINFEEPDEDIYFNQLPESAEKYHIHESEFCRVGGFKFSADEKIYEDLNGINELIYNSK